jgi:hypothetical protein
MENPGLEIELFYEGRGRNIGKRKLHLFVASNG